MELNEKIEVMQACAQGAGIQMLDKWNEGADWKDILDPDWNFSAYDYRIKPVEPAKTPEEVLALMKAVVERHEKRDLSLIKELKNNTKHKYKGGQILESYFHSYASDRLFGIQEGITRELEIIEGQYPNLIVEAGLLYVKEIDNTAKQSERVKEY